MNWIVVPGGPGLSAAYLKYGLTEPLRDLKLTFYDPLGSPEMPCASIPSINDLVNQILEVAERHNFKKYGLITHSFGNYLALRALEKTRDSICALLMISPMPFKFKSWQMAIQKIAEKIPTAVRREIRELTKKKGGGSKIFKLLLPYYVAKPVNVPKIPFDSEVCEQIAKQVFDYDDSAFILSNRLPPWRCIVGENDPFFIEKELITEKTVVVPNVGHYPFFEDPAAFSEAIGNLSPNFL